MSIFTGKRHTPVIIAVFLVSIKQRITRRIRLTSSGIVLPLKTYRNFVFLSVVSVIAFLQMIYQITLPGLYYDEAYHAVYGTWILTGQRVLFGRPLVYNILGLPILGSGGGGYYVGPLQGYLALLSMALFGINVVALRILPILFTVAALPFVFFFMKSRFGSISAYVSTCLFAFQPSLLLYSRLGLWASTILVFFLCSSLYFFDKWLSTGNRVLLAIGFLLLGLGFETFITFAWYILALAVTVIILRIKINVRRPDIPLLLGSFTAGVGPYLLSWFTGDTPYFISRYWQVSRVGINNLDYAGNLFRRLSDFRILMEGSAFTFYGNVHSNSVSLALFGVSIFGLTFLFILRWRLGVNNKTGKGHVGLIALFTLMLLQTPFTISTFNELHLIPLLPLSLMIVGAFAGTIWNADEVEWKHFNSPRIRLALRFAKIVALLVLCSSVVLDFSVVFAYQTDLQRTGGVSRWSDAIYKASDYLMNATNCTYVLAVDWGLSWPLFVISGGRLHVREMVLEPPNSFEIEAKYWMSLMKERLLCFIAWRPNWATDLNKLDLLQKLVRDRNDLLVLERTFYQRDLTPVIDIYRIISQS